MSYSFSFKVREGADIVADECFAAFAEVKQNISEDYAAEVAEHVSAIANAAADIVDDGALGVGRLVIVSVSGHAEPGHVKRDGYSQDFISLTFTQVQEEPVAS